MLADKKYYLTDGINKSTNFSRTGVKFILKVLAMSVVPLFYLSLMTFCVMVFFALEGLELFIGELHGGCFASFTTPDGASVACCFSRLHSGKMKSMSNSVHSADVALDHWMHVLLMWES